MGQNKKSDGPIPSDEEDTGESDNDWLIRAIDLLASEYKWSKADILEQVYFDELFYLSGLIRKRRAIDYKMQLAIVTNPHITDEEDRQILWDLLTKESGGRQEDSSDRLEEFDPNEFSKLKVAMSDNPHMIIKG